MEHEKIGILRTGPIEEYENEYANGDVKTYAMVLPPGTPVLINMEVPGHIDKVCIEEGGYVTYEVRWWAGLENRHDWMPAFHLTPKNVEDYKPIGFIK